MSRFKKQIVLVSAMIFLLLLTGSLLIICYQSKTILQSQLFDVAESNARHYATMVSNTLSCLRDEILVLASTSEIKSMDWQRQLSILLASVETDGSCDVMHMADETGIARTTLDTVIDVSDNDYYQSAMAGEVACSSSFISQTTGLPVIVIAAPIFSDSVSNPIGVIACEIRLDFFQSLIEDLHIGLHGYGWIIDGRANTIAHPDKQYLGNQNILQYGDSRFGDIVSRMMSGEYGTGFYSLDGVEKMAAFAPIPLTSWSICSLTDVSKVLAPVAVIRANSMVIIVVMVLLTLIICYLSACNTIKLEESRHKLRELFHNAYDVIVLCRMEDDGVIGQFTEVNKAACQILGYGRSELLGMTLRDVIALELLDEFAKGFSILQEQGYVTMETVFVSKDGTRISMELSGNVYVVNGESVIQIIARDVTERKKMEQEVHKARERLHITLLSIGDAVITTDVNGNITLLNKMAQELTGWSEIEAMGTPISQVFKIINEHTRQPTENPVDMVLTQGSIVTLASHTILVAKNGVERLIADSAAPIRSRDGTIEGIVLVFRDVTEAAETKRQIRHLSLYDKLTGLFNRRHFEDMLKRLDNRKDLPFSLVMGDVNGLRLINDAFGHQEGDKLLVTMANILKESCRKDDLLARWGGDEFIMFLPQACNRVAREVCERIRNGCKDSSSGLLQLSIALGYATRSKMEQPVEQVLKETEETMYTNKLRESSSIRNSLISSLKQSLYETDYETEEHTRRLEELAIRMGKALNLTGNQLDQLVLLAGLHDIGKIAIPKEILMKTTPLSIQEWETLKKHPEIGYRIASLSPDLVHVDQAILAHHENWDGSGYPHGLKGKDIPLSSRIVSIIDAYDAMTNDRPYRKASSHESALDELMRWSGKQFDPYLVRLFIEMVSNS